jgi:Mg2+/citrate symporter
MTHSQHSFAVVLSLVTFVVIVELVRRRKLREEYSFLWIATSLGMLVLSSWYGLVEWITRLSGAVLPTTTLFIFALAFLLLISVHFSTVLSRLTQQVRRLTQEVAILTARRPGQGEPPPGERAAQGPALGGQELSSAPRET